MVSIFKGNGDGIRRKDFSFDIPTICRGITILVGLKFSNGITNVSGLTIDFDGLTMTQ